jgi:hypothetical protein
MTRRLLLRVLTLGLLSRARTTEAAGIGVGRFPWQVAYPSIWDADGHEICLIQPTDSMEDRGQEIAAFIVAACNEAARRGQRP